MIYLVAVTACAVNLTLHAEPAESGGKADSYTQRVRQCLDLLMAHGTDTPMAKSTRPCW